MVVVVVVVLVVVVDQRPECRLQELGNPTTCTYRSADQNPKRALKRYCSRKGNTHGHGHEEMPQMETAAHREPGDSDR